MHLGRGCNVSYSVEPTWALHSFGLPTWFLMLPTWFLRVIHLVPEGDSVEHLVSFTEEETDCPDSLMV